MGNYGQGIRSDLLQRESSFGKSESPVFDEITGEGLLMMKIDKIPSLLEPMLPKVGLACLAGSSDTGKSAFLRQFAMCVAAGVPTFLGMKLNAEHRSAIYVSTEDDEMASAYLVNRQNKELGLTPSCLKKLRFIFDTEDVVKELDARMSAMPADLVIVDCFSDLYIGSMNESNQVRQFLNQYALLANKHKCLIVFLHHCGKRTENFLPSKHNLLGSQAFEAKMRLVLELRTDMANVTYKHLCCVKGNYLSAEYKTESIKMQFSENLVFTETGERVPFENLVPIASDNDSKYNVIKQYQEDGLTLEQIAKKVGYKDKSGVSKFLERYNKKKM